MSQVTLFAVDLGAAAEAWRTRPLDRLVSQAPRGRVASLLAAPVDGVIVDGGKPAAHALHQVTPDSRRALFEAMIEDLATAAVWDAPLAPLAEVFAAAVRLSKRRELGLHGLVAASRPAYPPEVELQAGVRLRQWTLEPALGARAAVLLRDALRKPATLGFTADAVLCQDLAEAVAQVLTLAGRPGHALVALGEFEGLQIS